MSNTRASALSQKKKSSLVSWDFSRGNSSSRLGSKLLFGKRTSSVFRKGHICAELKVPLDYNGCHTIRYSPDEETFVCGFGTGCIQIRNASDGELIGTLRGPSKNEPPIMAARFLPGNPNILFAASINGSIYSCRRRGLICSLFAEEKQNEINALDINSEGNLMISGGKDAVLRIYDICTKKAVQRLAKGENDNSNGFHLMRIFAIKCHPDNPEIFFSGGWDNCVKIWDTRVKGGCVKNVNGPHICGDAIDVKDSSILTASWTLTDSLQIFDWREGELLDTIRPVNKQDSLEGEFYYVAKFYRGPNAGDLICAGGSGTGSLDVIQRSLMKVKIQYRTNKTILTLDTRQQCCVFGGLTTSIKIAELPMF